jgi:hypothetical protein
MSLLNALSVTGLMQIKYMAKSVSLKALAISNGALNQAELPSRIKVLDWGKSKTLDGEILFDEKSAECFYDNQHAIGRTLAPLDFNHNTVKGTQAYDADKEPRAVAGYGVPTVVANDGLYYEYMRWTPSGNKSARDYADLSPAVITDQDNRVIAIHSCALTPAGAVENLSFYSADDVASLMAKTGKLKAHNSDDDDKEHDDDCDCADCKAKDKSGKGKMKAMCAYADVANGKYPIDTEEHVRAAWSYIHMARNQKGYSSDEISAIKRKIADKAKTYKITLKAEAAADAVKAAALPNAYNKAIQPYEQEGIDNMLGEHLEYFRKALNLGDEATPDDIMKWLRAKWEGMEPDKEVLPFKTQDASVDPQVRNDGPMDRGGPGQPHGTITYNAEERARMEKLVTDKVSESIKTLSTELTTLKTERDNKLKELETEKRQMIVDQASRDRKVIPLTADEINAIPIATLESMVAKLKPEVNTEKQALRPMSADGQKPDLTGALSRASQAATDYFARVGVTWRGPSEIVPAGARNLNPKNPVDSKN